MGKSTISMATFNSYVSSPEGKLAYGWSASESASGCATLRGLEVGEDDAPQWHSQTLDDSSRFTSIISSSWCQFDFTCNTCMSAYQSYQSISVYHSIYMYILVIYLYIHIIIYKYTLYSSIIYIYIIICIHIYIYIYIYDYIYIIIYTYIYIYHSSVIIFSSKWSSFETWDHPGTRCPRTKSCGSFFNWRLPGKAVVGEPANGNWSRESDLSHDKSRDDGLPDFEFGNVWNNPVVFVVSVWFETWIDLQTLHALHANRGERPTW